MFCTCQNAFFLYSFYIIFQTKEYKMKKILAAAVAALVSFGAFAGDWQSTIGAGVSPQKSTIGIDEDEDLNLSFNGHGMGDIGQWAVDFDLTYLLVNTANSLSFKADFVAGAAIPTSDWITADMGFNIGGDIGIGYSFIHSQKATLGAFAMFGLDYTSYSWTYEPDGMSYKVVSIDLDESAFCYKIGADLLGAVRFTDHLGLFGSFGVRWILGGTASASLSGAGYSIDTDMDISGKICLIPTIGLSWTF